MILPPDPLPPHLHQRPRGARGDRCWRLHPAWPPGRCGDSAHPDRFGIRAGVRGVCRATFAAPFVVLRLIRTTAGFATRMLVALAGLPRASRDRTDPSAHPSPRAGADT